MPLTPQMIQAMNAASGKSVPLDLGAPPSRADQIRSIAKSSTSTQAIAAGTEPDYISRVGTDLKDAGNGIKENLDSIPSRPSLGTEITKGFETAGDVAGAVSVPIAELPGVKQVGGGLSGAGTSIASKLMEIPAYSKFFGNLSSYLDAHPDVAHSIGSGFNLAMLGLGGEGALEGAGAAKDIAGKIGDSVPDIPAESTSPPPVTPKPANIVSEAAGNIARNVKNHIEDMQQTSAQKAALQAKGPNAVKIFNESGSPEFINNIDKTNSIEDLKAKQQMLETAAQHPKMGGSGPVDTLPRQVIADEYITPRINTLQNRLAQLGKIIGDAKTNNTSFDTTDVFNHMINEAKKVGVHVGQDEEGKLTFSKAPGISGIDNSRISTIKNMFDGFEPDEKGKTANSVAQLAATRKNLSDLTSRSDAAKEVVGPGGPIDSTRRFIAQKIGPEYHAATKDYSDIARVLDQLDPDLKVRLSDEGTKDITKVKLSDYARRLLSNNAAQAKSVFTSLDELAQKEAARTGKPLPKQNLADLVDTAGAIEEGLGITPRNSFFGQTSGATKNALGGFPTSVGEAVGKVADIMTKSKGSPRRALQAMQGYVEDAIRAKK